MATDIVLVPTHRRPEFLAITLELLRRCDLHTQHFFVVLVDRGADPDTFKIIERYSPGLQLQVLSRLGEHSYRGNSYNVLEGYRYALHLAARLHSRLIYLVEEDAWVSADLFTFSRQVHSALQPFAFSASMNLNNSPGGGPVFKPADPCAVYAHSYYQSVCPSLPISAVQRIVAHAQPAYYSEPERYLQAHFPSSRWGNFRREQDGLIDRIMEQTQDKQLYPYLPRAMHAGFVGENRPGWGLTGSVDTRLRALRTLSEQAMNDRALVYKDTQSINFSGAQAQQIVLKD
jgi:hypothetical protein